MEDKNKPLIEFTKNGDKTIDDIKKHFNLSENKVRYRVAKYNITIKKNKPLIERNNLILKLLEEDKLSASEIGKKFNMSKSSVLSIGQSLGYLGRHESRRNKYIDISKNVNEDIESGLTYNELKEKYTRNVLRNLQGRELLNKLYSDFMVERNNKIVDSYKTTIARKIIESDDVVFKNPTKLKMIKNVYNISTKQGFKKYPKIGDRSKGGTFEDKKILRYIQDKRDNKGWTYKKIADKLNTLGYRTLTGKIFDVPNVLYKYNAYKKNKYRRLEY